ncbi:MAG: cyclase family protein [Terriglobales bacterium]|jgi:kynurenine formamidase
MRFRGFVITYALVLALLLFADQRRALRPQNHYSQVVDLTDGTPGKRGSEARSAARIISPAALIPGTWGAAQIPAERLIAPLVVMDLNASSAQISVDDIANWEAQHGIVPQGAIVAVRRVGSGHSSCSDQFPMSTDAAQFLMDARYSVGFVVETPVNLGSNPTLSRQIALHGNYVVEGSARLAAVPETGSLIIVAPEKDKNAAKGPVRVLAMSPLVPNRLTKPGN